MKICDALKLGFDILGNYLESRILLQHAIGKSTEYLIANNTQYLIDKEQIKFISYLQRRANNEPIAYITGYKEFYSLDFIINNKVLIPRADTEILVEAILAYIKENNNKKQIRLLDLGTGSGCISITLAHYVTNLQIVATDISLEALNIAKLNTIKHMVSDKIDFIQSDWFQNIKIQKFDIIVSNPPYINRKDVSYVIKETMNYEPHLALFADNNGIKSYIEIAKNSPLYLKDDGAVFVEIGFNQFDEVSNIFTHHGYILQEKYLDLSGKIRALCFGFNLL